MVVDRMSSKANQMNDGNEVLNDASLSEDQTQRWWKSSAAEIR